MKRDPPSFVFARAQKAVALSAPAEHVGHETPEPVWTAIVDDDAGELLRLSGKAAAPWLWFNAYVSCGNARRQHGLTAHGRVFARPGASATSSQALHFGAT